MKLRLFLLAICLAACTTSGSSPTPAPATTASPAAARPTPTRQPSPAPTQTIPPAPTRTPASTDPAASATPQATLPAGEEVLIAADDGLLISGAFYPAEGPAPWPGVLLLHMAYRTRADWNSLIPLLVRAGYAVLAVDLRGHGDTGGSIDWDKAAADMPPVWRYLSGRPDVDAARTAILGASMGASLALHAGAGEPAVRILVLLSPGLNYFGLATEAAMQAYGDRPVLMVAGSQNTYPAKSAQELAEIAPQAQLQTYDTSAHGTDLLQETPEISPLILDWLEEHLKGNRPSS